MGSGKQFDMSPPHVEKRQLPAPAEWEVLMISSTNLVGRRDHFDYEMLMVVAGFLGGYTENTLLAYQQDLRPPLFLAAV